jgi:hypothetical protein
MPLRREANGGWRRLSTEEAATHDEAVERAERHAHVRTGGAVLIKGENDDGELSSWASEGMRRVQQERVYRRMTVLTGMAAIGGCKSRTRRTK